jgi:hypothetical protein
MNATIAKTLAPLARPLGASLLLAASAALGATSAQAATALSTPATGHQGLPLYRLVRTAAPTSFVSAALSAGGVHALAVEGGRLVSRDAQGVMHAYADPRTGDAQIFPDIAPSRNATTHVAPAAIAASVFARFDVIPKDATTIRIGDSTRVFGASASRGPNNTTIAKSGPQLYFTYVPAIRYADGLQVFGQGSQATVAVGTDGSVRGLVRRWEAAVPAGIVVPTLTPAQVLQNIHAQLASHASDERIIVDSVKLAYYDNNAQYLQPVYVFMATLRPLHGGSDDHIRGFVPFGKLVEPIPVVGRLSGAMPTEPAITPGQGGGGVSDSSQVTLGEYANDNGEMQDQANAYYDGFDSVTPGVYGPPINRTQWYFAHSWMYYGSANTYPNDVQIAYTSPHGNWWVNSTNGTGGDDFYINKIGVGGNPGYGSSSSGRMVTWIIDSCEVAPSYYDLQYTTGNGNTAFNNWWPVFQGLHRVLAYRTEMLLGEDTMNYDIGQSLAEGANAGSAYYNGVAAFSFGTYTDGHLSLTVHYDRVSIFNDTRNGSESIYKVQGQSPSGSLNNSWMDN